jgi:hypothetical protein
MAVRRGAIRRWLGPSWHIDEALTQFAEFLIVQ